MKDLISFKNMKKENYSKDQILTSQIGIKLLRKYINPLLIMYL